MNRLVDHDDRNILILGILIFILLAIAYYFLLLSPLQQEYRARYDERTQKEAQRTKLEGNVAELENIRRNSSDVERQILEYSKRIPDQDEIPALVVQREEVAQKAGVTQLLIERGSPEAPPGGGDFSRIPLTMSFEGTYEEMQDFVLRLRNLARLVTINGVTYEDVQRRGGRTGGERTSTEERGRKLLAVEIRAETYIQPAASGATTSAAGGTTTPRGATNPPPAAGSKAGAGKTEGGQTK